MYCDISHLDDNDIISILPTCHSAGIKYGTRKLKDRVKITLTYYKGVEKISIIDRVEHLSKNELKNKIDLLKSNIKDANKINDILKIKKSDLTDDIISKFRYCQKVIDYDENEVLIDPYILGVWLGDGHSHTPALTSIDNPLIEIWNEYAKKIGLQVTKAFRKERKLKIKEGETKDLYAYNITSGINSGKMNRNIFKEWLKEYDLISNKHIPECYLKNSMDVRLQILAGLIDTDGYLSGNKYEIVQKSKRLSEDIVKLSNSLGFFTIMKSCDKCCTNSKTKAINTYYRIYISLNQVSYTIPVILDRKKITKMFNYCNPKIIINKSKITNITEKMEWTDDTVKLLCQMVKRFRIEEGDKPIPWKKFIEKSDIFSDASPDSLRATWRDIQKIIDMDNVLSYEGEFNLYDHHWLKRYNTVIEKLEKDESLDKSDLSWINNQKHRNSKYKCEEELLLKIPQYATKDVDRWNIQYDSIIESITLDIALNKKQKTWLMNQRRRIKSKKKFRDGEKDRFIKLEGLLADSCV